MEKNIKVITYILEAIEKSVESESIKWENEKPSLEKTFTKVKENGNHEMENAKANYSTVKDSKGVKLNTKPAFSSIKDPGSNGGAKSNAKVNSQKNPYKESTNPKMDKVMGEFEKGTLKTNTGKKVTNPKQAVAIGYSEAKNLKEEIEDGFNYGSETIPKFKKKENKKVVTKPTNKTNPIIKKKGINPILDEEEIMEVSTNVKKLTDRNPAINESEKFENTLPLNIREKAKKLREAIEIMSGKKVFYSNKK